MSARESLVDRWSETLWWDHVAAALFVAGHVMIIHLFHRSDWLLWIDSGQRTSMYASAAGVVSAIGGLSSIAISIYLATDGPRAQAVRRHYQRELRRNWKSLLVATAAICFACLIAQGLDNPKDNHSARFLFELAMALSVMRFIRMIWLFDIMMQVNDRDLSDPTPEPTPIMNPNWKQRRRNDVG